MMEIFLYHFLTPGAALRIISWSFSGLELICKAPVCVKITEWAKYDIEYAQYFLCWYITKNMPCTYAHIMGLWNSRILYLQASSYCCKQCQNEVVKCTQSTRMIIFSVLTSVLTQLLLQYCKEIISVQYNVKYYW